MICVEGLWLDDYVETDFTRKSNVDDPWILVLDNFFAIIRCNWARYPGRNVPLSDLHPPTETNSTNYSTSFASSSLVHFCCDDFEYEFTSFAIIANCGVVKPRVTAEEDVSQLYEDAGSPIVKKYKTIIYPSEQDDEPMHDFLTYGAFFDVQEIHIGCSRDLLRSLIVGSLQQIFHKEGLRGMYRGLAPTVLALLPNWAVLQESIEAVKPYWSN
uniref:Uncharacterized protein n=1 Tax=Cucumis melo TaxID=3656 RepID=A0A9I9EA78_CUCME